VPRGAKGNIPNLIILVDLAEKEMDISLYGKFEWVYYSFSDPGHVNVCSMIIEVGGR
jgi:hypothetical protein